MISQDHLELGLYFPEPMCLQKKQTSSLDDIKLKPKQASQKKQSHSISQMAAIRHSKTKSQKQPKQY